MSGNSEDPVDAYWDFVQRVLKSLDLVQVREAGSLIADSLKVGGIIHAFGTGHSSLLAQEIFYRAGGLVAINPILDVRLGFERGATESTEFERSSEAADEIVRLAGFEQRDVGIVISNSGRNALPVEMALRMKAAGMKVVALTSLAYSRASVSRHASGKRLFEIADCVLDNHCPPGDASIEVPGMPAKMGPLSTIVGAAILHGAVIEAARQLAVLGKPPAVLISVNVGTSSVWDLKDQLAPYASRIRYYRPGGL
ncbi:MAG TPA: SIS domain-containing protein [Terriglobia bacterium]|nr:SIS domain-containing protein [Terriglobia bacterium]